MELKVFNELIFLSIDDSRAWCMCRDGVEGFCRIGFMSIDDFRV